MPIKEIGEAIYTKDAAWLQGVATSLGVDIENNQLKFPETVGQGILREFVIEPGLTLTFGELEPRKQLQLRTKALDKKIGFTILFKYIERGSSFFKPISGQYTEVKAGGVQFLSSNVKNHLIFPASSHCYLFRLFISNEWIANNLAEFIGQNGVFREMIFDDKKVMHFEPLNNRFVRLFKDVFKSEFDSKLVHLIVKDKGYEAVVIFFDHFYKQFFSENIQLSKYSISDQKRLYMLVDYIHANLDKNLSLDDLAKEAGFSKSKLQSMFHYFFHQSIYNFIKNLKFEKAVSLLVKTDDDIRFVASKLGYNSSTHFINIFKRHFGVSPYKYRINQRKQNAESGELSAASSTSSKNNRSGANASQNFTVKDMSIK
jgi:AraC-like DNA-binding protein